MGDGFCPDMQLGVRVRIEVRGSRVRPVAILLPMILFSIVRGQGSRVLYVFDGTSLFPNLNIFLKKIFYFS